MRLDRTIATLLTISVISGCDQMFDPLQVSDQHFSVYGYLDAAAAIQWVRITPIRDSVFTSADSPVPVVALNELPTGDRVMLNDSLFSYSSPNLDLTLKRYTLNYWTTNDIRPATTYKLTVVATDGTESSATAVIPDDFQRIVVGQDLRNPERGYVRLENIEHLAMVVVLHHLPEGCLFVSSPYSVHQRDSRHTSADGRHIVLITRNPDRDLGCPIIRKEVQIVSSGVEWPFDPTVDDLLLPPPNMGSNVDSGAGFLGGVVAKVVPLENCGKVDTPAVGEHCEMIYSPEAAMLEGNVSSDCEPAGGASIKLTHADGVSLRTALADGGGYFQVGALLPNVEYGLVVSRGSTSWQASLLFDVGERRRVDVALGTVPC